MSTEEEHLQKPSDYFQNHSEGEVVTVNDSGVHINHAVGHQTHLEGAMGSAHTFEIEEAEAFAKLINSQLVGDSLSARHLPLAINDSDLFEKLHDGLILARIINIAAPGTIDENKLNRQANMSVFQKNENLNVVVKAASSLKGVHIVNIGAQDISEGRQIPILGMLWQIFRIGLVAHITLDGHPELILLLLPGETLADLAKLSPEQVLLRWVRYNLARSGKDFRVNSFNDFKNPEVFLALLHQLDPSISTLSVDADPLATAQRVIDAAKALGVDTFLRASDILSGNPRLALGFTAQIFNKVGIENDVESSAFAVYINKHLEGDAVVAHLLPLNPATNDVYLRQNDGLILAELLKEARPDAVDAAHLNTHPNLEDADKLANIAVVLGVAQAQGANVEGISAEEVLDGRPKPVLAALWAVISLRLLAKVNLNDHPELAALAEEGESPASLAALSPHDLLLRWFNHHLRAAGYNDAPLTNFDEDLKNVGMLDMVAQQLVNGGDESTTSPPIVAPRSKGDDFDVASHAIDNARSLGVDVLVTPQDLLSDAPTLGEMFVADLFNARTGIPMVSVDFETVAFTGYLNAALAGDASVADVVPLSLDRNDLYSRGNDGRLAAALLNQVAPGLVNAADFGADKASNARVVLAAAKAIGGNTDDVDADEVAAGNHKAVLEFFLVIIKLKLISTISKTNITVLLAALSAGGVADALVALPPEAILLRWMDSHFRRSNSELVVNFDRS